MTGLPSPRRQRRWPWVTAGVIGLGGAGAALALLGGDREPMADTPSDSIRAVTAETRALIEFDDLDGRLGLAIAKTIVEAHGGTIGAESTPGQGTIIIVELPVST